MLLILLLMLSQILNAYIAIPASASTGAAHAAMMTIILLVLLMMIFNTRY